MGESQKKQTCEKIAKKHEGEEIYYTACPQNGCFDNCLLRCHVKDGILSAIEVGDDKMHTNTGREDEYCDVADLREGIYQHRACVRGRGWRKDVYSPTRIKYPMLRVGERGERKFKRISWEEALDLAAEWYKETREKYGPLSVFSDGAMGFSYDPFGSYFPGGALGTWAIDSNEPHDFADDTCFGIRMTMKEVISGEWWSSADCTTFLDSKLIILWGVDVALNYNDMMYHLLLARDKGIPIIYIDPRLTWTGTLADQWIPIRPGTDGAMMEAMGYLLFEEDLYDHEFVDKWVEPYGLQRWKEYLYGQDDGIVKTPEWAESICGVPAETITALTRLYASSHPVYFRMVWAAARMLYGENQARTSNYLLAMCKNIGHYGTLGAGNAIQINPHVPEPYPPNLGQIHGEYPTRCVLEAELWAHAVMLREKVDNGEMTLDDYKAEIGCPAEEEAPNVQMVFLVTNPRNVAVDYYNANERIEALKKVSRVVYAGYDWNNTTTWYADLVLPMCHQFFENGGSIQDMFNGGYSFNQGFGQGINNYFIGIGLVTKAPGEAACRQWILKEMANRLGLGDKFAPRIKDVSREDFNDVMLELAKESYQYWSVSEGIAELDPPEWEDFIKYPLFRKRIGKDYKVALKENFEKDIPLATESGKIEFYSKWLAEKDFKKSVMSGSKCLGKGTVTPIGKYRPQEYSLSSAKTNEWPLYMITPHSYYRQHFCQDGNPWFRDEQRRSIWLSVPDAKARGIKDGDQVLVHNDVGQCLLPAYVTSRLTPGVCCVIFGRQYEPSSIKTNLMPDGIDRAGSCNFLISTDHGDARRGILLCNGLVEVENAEFTLTGTFE